MRVRASHLVIATCAVVFLGGMLLMRQSTGEGSLPEGPRKAAWTKVEQSLSEGRPKSAAAALEGIVEEAIADQAWAEAARGIATRVLAETGDRPADDPERLIQLDAAIASAPPQSRGVLKTVAANWMWNYFLANRWRFAQRTRGAAASDDLATIAQWDLPLMVAEIAKRFDSVLEDEMELKSLAIQDWRAIIDPGVVRFGPLDEKENPSPEEVARAVALRPTVWDVVMANAVAFFASSERDLLAPPEDMFEPDAAGPILGGRDAFLSWNAGEQTSDQGSPVLKVVMLYQAWLRSHQDDADATPALSIDFQRIQWATDEAVGGSREQRGNDALERFIQEAGDHELATRGRAALAEKLFGQNDPPAAHALASEGVAAHPDSVGGAECRNLIARIEEISVSLETERTWAEPWPVIRASYVNLTRMYFRVVVANWEERLEAGRPEWQWLEAEDRTRILAAKPVRSFTADLPATLDYRAGMQDISVPKDLPSGCYWILASAKEDFSESDNEVAGCFVWVSRLALVADTDSPRSIERDGWLRKGQPKGLGDGELAGHIVDVRTGEPLAGAKVHAHVQPRNPQRQGFRRTTTVTTDAEGRYVIRLNGDMVSRESVVLEATAAIDGVLHRIGDERTSIRRYRRPERTRTAILVTDRGIHRPGQTVFYKGIACEADTRGNSYQSLPDMDVTVVFRDANNRELATANHRTNSRGSFHGSFSIPASSLPGQWSITAQGGGVNGSVGVRVEEYKRPKFLVELSAPEGEVQLDSEVTLKGTASTYTGFPVAGGRVSWAVRREAIFAPWCRWQFPWLPIGRASVAIAHGETISDADGHFEVVFPASPDASVPREALPVFFFQVTATVTDASGETRQEERVVRVGYAPLKAEVNCDAWQAVEAGEASVELTLSTASLDDEPRGATGLLSVSRLVQPDAVAREDLLFEFPILRQRGGLGGGAFALSPQDDGQPHREVDPVEPETWPAGEQVYSAEQATDPATGRATVNVTLEPGIYRAEFEIPGDGDAPAVKATKLVEVIDPAAERYPVKRGFALAAPSWTVEPGETFEAVIGTGYDTGRVLIEVLQNNIVLSRHWSEPGRTQWPISLAVDESHRGGFTLRAWMVRDGRLHDESRTINVPWTDKKLDITWERFTRQTEPGTKEVWRAKVATLPETTHPDAVAASVEMLAVLYDQSLDALAAHRWPAEGLLNLFRKEQPPSSPTFTNTGLAFHVLAGSWSLEQEPVEIRLPALLAEFGQPSGMRFGRGRFFGAMGGGVAFAAAAPMEMDAAVADEPMAANFSNRGYADAFDLGQEEKRAGRGGILGGPLPEGSPDAPLPPRRNLTETAFFLPSLVSDQNGLVTIEFTLPDTLTTWQFKGLAHDGDLRSGVIDDTAVAVKDLMVEPVVPRFLREGDRVRIPVKLSNRSSGRLSGSVRFGLADTRTGADRSGLVVDGLERSFDLAAGESQPVMFTVDVGDGAEPLTYLATGTAGRAADGEEGTLPVLSRRVLVSESVPVTLRGDDEQTVELEKLREGSPDLKNESLVVQVASNPAWYAVLAMPSLVEETDEGIDTLFRRLYVNSLAQHLVTRDPRIARVFEQWRGTDALESPLAKNTQLMTTLLAETPWVRDAVDEREARARIGLLFDATRADNEVKSALERLSNLHNGDGGWPWFPGGGSSDAITLAIVSGFGRLRTSGVELDLTEPFVALRWVDSRLVEEAARGKQLLEAAGDRKADLSLTSIGVFALYARSFFLKDQPPSDEVREAMRFCLSVGRESWMQHTSRRVQAQLALALSRVGDRETARSIIDSLRERAVGAPGTPEASAEGVAWQGMWWRDPHPFWWSWAGAPIETQAQLIEAFDEVAGDAESVEAMKAWLLSQKRTSQWSGSSATVNAVAALLGRGEDLLGQPAEVSITVGGEAVEPETVEAGTGFFETRRVRREIRSQDGTIQFRRTGDRKAGAGFAWGGVHWQYLDDIANVDAAGSEQLAVEKQLFVRRVTKAGSELVAIEEGASLTVGDEVVVRLVVTSDRDYEFLELSDHRASLTEPVDVLSGWRWADGVGWYAATRDTCTQFFFERMPRGTHVLEYALRVAHAGEASSGFATIRSRYAPEFSAHSGSVSLTASVDEKRE